MTNLVWRTARELGYRDEFVPLREGIEDDHYPFRRAGVPAIDLIDFRYGGGRANHEMFHSPHAYRRMKCLKFVIIRVVLFVQFVD